MKWLFADTAGWVAAADAANPVNVAVCEARDRWLESNGLILTTDYVIDETLTVLRIRLGLRAARAWWRQMEASQCLRIEWMNAERAERARALFFRFRDKAYSFTDCCSFVVMKEQRIQTAWTLDNHFRQAGFDVTPAVTVK